MVEEIRDYSDSIRRYESGLKRFKDNNQLPKNNRLLALEWIKIKENALQEGLSLTEKQEEKHRYSKTLVRYLHLLRNICYWFPDLKNITEEELKKFKEDFYNDKIKSTKGKILTGKRDYVTKVIKSDFFKWLGHEAIVKKVFNHKIKNKASSVEFLTFDDVMTLVNKSKNDYHKIGIMLLFSTGVRIGTLLNLKKRDFEIKYNEKTKIYYYLVHIRREYTKSKDDRTIPIIIPECNEMLKKYINSLSANDFIIPINYKTLSDALKSLCEKSGIKTKPNNERTPNIHILRKSATLFWLNKGYSTDQVKALLGHKPSSDAIDLYANYSGLDLEPTTTKVQVDELLKLHKELEHTKLQLTSLQQEQDNMKGKLEKLELIQELLEKVLDKPEEIANIKKALKLSK